MQHVRIGGPNATQSSGNTHNRVTAMQPAPADSAAPAPLSPDHRAVPIAVLAELDRVLSEPLEGPPTTPIVLGGSQVQIPAPPAPLLAERCAHARALIAPWL